MALPVSFSCRGLGFGSGWGSNVARYSGRMNLQTTKEVRKGTHARLFSSSSSRATLDFGSSSCPSASGLHRDYSRSRTRPASLDNSASLSRLLPRFQNLNTTRQYQNMASRPESEDREVKKGITFKVENQTTPAEPTTLPPSTHASSTSKPPTPPPDSSSHDSIPTNAQQRRTDWRIIKRLMINVWPRNDWKTRLTVLGGFGLLVSAKVCLLIRFVLEFSITFFVGPQRSSPADFQSSNRFTQCRNNRLVNGVDTCWFSYPRM
jgi:ABC transporter ATM